MAQDLSVAYTVIGNSVLRTLLAHANKMPTFMPETGAFKDDIKADSEVPTRAKKARKSRLFKDSICYLQRSNAKMKIRERLASFFVDEMADITFYRLLDILMDVLMASLQEILDFNDEQLTVFAADFESRLPGYLRNALHLEAVAA